MKIAVLDDYPDIFRRVSSYPRLWDHEVVIYHDTVKDPVKLAERLKDFDAVVLTQERSRFPRAVVERLPRLKLIAQTGSHRHHFDIDACTERGIVITSGGGGKAYSTAELTWALILASLRHIPYEVERLKQGHWQSTVGTGLRDKTLGIYGLGRIGGWVAEVGRAFGMKVSCWGRETTRKRAQEEGYEIPASREAFFAGADVLSLQLFYNEETHGIVTAADLALMKPTALLVNTGRMNLIQPGALATALKQGRPGFAAVDVYEDEPVLGADHPLLKMPNALCTPHLGYCALEKYEEIYQAAIEGILAFAAGKPVKVVNPEALTRR